MLVESFVNTALDAMFPTGTGTDRAYLTQHPAYDATGANFDATTGKVAGTWAGASSRSKALTGAVDLPITAVVTVKWIGIWGGTAGNTFRGMVPNASTGDKTFQINDTSNLIVCEGHGYADGQKIVFHGGTPPTSITEGTTYFVLTGTPADPDTFTISDTLAGSPKTFSGQPAAGCVVSSITEETYSSSGTHRVSTLTIAL